MEDKLISEASCFQILYNITLPSHLGLNKKETLKTHRMGNELCFFMHLGSGNMRK